MIRNVNMKIVDSHTSLPLFSSRFVNLDSFTGQLIYSFSCLDLCFTLRETRTMSCALLCCHGLSFRSFKEMSGQRCISVSCWVGTRLQWGRQRNGAEEADNGQLCWAMQHRRDRLWAVSRAEVCLPLRGDRDRAVCTVVMLLWYLVVRLKYHVQYDGVIWA